MQQKKAATDCEGQPLPSVASMKLEDKPPKWEIDYGDLEIGKRIGGGTFGTVFQGTYQNGDVAIKQLNLEASTNEYVIREMKNMCVLRHSNIVTMYGLCICEAGAFIVTEYVSGGDLRKKLNSHILNNKLKLRMLLDTAGAMYFIHQQGYIHRDLKSQNLLVTADWRIKLSDFGLSRKVASDSAMTFAVGTMEWMAPECLLLKPYAQPADVFSFGVVIYEVLTADLPPRRNPLHHYAITIAETSRPADTPVDLWELMQECLDITPEKRPTFDKIVERLKAMMVNYKDEEITATEREAPLHSRGGSSRRTKKSGRSSKKSGSSKAGSSKKGGSSSSGEKEGNSKRHH